MTEIKRYSIGDAHHHVYHVDSGAEFYLASDFDQLQREREALRVENEDLTRANSNLLQLVRINNAGALIALREQAAQVCQKYRDEHAGTVAGHVARSIAEEIKNLPLPPSAERVAAVLKAAKVCRRARSLNQELCDAVDALERELEEPT